MDYHANTEPSAVRSILIPLAGYRVTAWRPRHGQALVTLAENLRQAVNRAQAFCDKIAGAPRGIVSVRVEEWVGTLTVGQWRPVSLRCGGFSHRFAKPRKGGPSASGDDCGRLLPKTGDRVECRLLSEKTRKGGWRASLLERPIEGPVTNTREVSTSAKAGQTVVLRVGAISQDGKRIQFHWQPSDNAERS